MADRSPTETASEDETATNEFFEEHLDVLGEPETNTWSISTLIETSHRPCDGGNPEREGLDERSGDAANRRQRSDLNEAAGESRERVGSDTIAEATDRSERDLSEPASAIFAELVRHHKVDEAEAERLARDITESFETRIDTSFAGWESSERTEIVIRNTIIDVLVKEHDRFDLAERRAFVESARERLIETAESPSTTT